MFKVEGYVHICEFLIDAEHHSEFIEQTLENARQSIATEKGCHRYEVLVPSDGSPRVVLYESYDSREEHKLHHTTPHFLKWKAGAAQWIKERRPVTLGQAV